MVFDSSKYLIDLYLQYMPNALSSGGWARQDFEAFYGAFGVTGKINLMIKVLNELEIFDSLLDPITIVSDQSSHMEMWANGDWGKGNMLVHSEGSEFHKRILSIPYDTYGHEISLDKFELLRAMAQENKTGSMAQSAFASIDLAIKTAVDGYKNKLRILALKALFYNPTTLEDPTLPVLYRDTTGFNAVNRVIPPRNGIKVFTAGADQEHHIAQGTIDEGWIKKMRKLIVDKGGDASQIVVVASETDWDEYTALFSNTELEGMKILAELGGADITTSAFTSTINVKLPDTVMPKGAWLAFDRSKQILQKRISDIPKLQGINVDFNTISKIKALNPTADFSTIKALADDSLIEAVNTGHLKLSMNQVGFGVIACGMAVVGYIGGATYVEPAFEVVG